MVMNCKRSLSGCLGLTPRVHSGVTKRIYSVGYTTDR